MWNCPNCREEVEDNFDVCWNCQTGKDGTLPANYFAAAKTKVKDSGHLKDSPEVKVKDSAEAASLMKRYTDAYLVARTINGFGSLIKVIAIVITIILVLIGFLVAAQNGPREPISYLGIMGIFTGILSGALFYIIGVLVSAQGQILKASLDGAVNSSPFLTNEQRKEIMSL